MSIRPYCEQHAGFHGFCSDCRTALSRQQFEAGRAKGWREGWRERGEFDVRAVVEWPLSAANMVRAAHWFKLIKPAKTAFAHGVASICRVDIPKAIKAVVLPAAQPAEEGKT